MKYLILFLALFTAVAQAQLDDNSKSDPQINLYNQDEVAASVVDITGTYAATVNQYPNVESVQSCPTCNLHGPLDLRDENGTPAVNKAEAQTSDSNGAQGQ